MTENRNLTGDEIAGAILALIVLLVPLFFVVVFPDTPWVAKYLGDGRIFLCWVIVFGLVWVFRKKFDQLMKFVFADHKQADK